MSEKQKETEKEDSMMKYVFIAIAVVAVVILVYFFFFRERCGDNICTAGENYANCKVDCPDCDDKKVCTRDSYNYETRKCSNTIILNCCGNDICEEDSEDSNNCEQDCPLCNDNVLCTRDEYDYESQSCMFTEIVPCCGNNVCEDYEDYLSCATDCVQSTVIQMSKNTVYQVKIGETYSFEGKEIVLDSIEGRGGVFKVTKGNEQISNRIFTGDKRDFMGVRIEVLSVYIRDSISYIKIKVS